MSPDADGVSESSTRDSVTQKVWVRICRDDELKEGAVKMMVLMDDNLQVSVWRHREKLYALDNRCAHMGGPLCDGDVEDLASHMSLDRSLTLKGGARKEDGVVKCPRHGQCFNLRTGENIEGGHMRQQVYPVRITDAGDIEAEVPVEVRSDGAVGQVVDGAGAGRSPSVGSSGKPKQSSKSSCDLQ